MYDNLRKWLDIDDLLFQSRNKDYGAYQLRKKYNSVVVAGIILATLLVSLAVILSFILTPRSDNVLNGNRTYTQLKMENLEPPKDEIYVPPAPPPPRRGLPLATSPPPPLRTSFPPCPDPLSFPRDLASKTTTFY